MDKRLRQKLTLTEQDPYLPLERGWVQDPKFCAAFFDRCEHLALVLSPDALELARRAVQFAETHGDPHLIHRSYGVLANAYYDRSDTYWAGKTLEEVKDRALACCPKCRSDHLHRSGDLLGELRQSEASLAALNQALEEGGRHISLETRARICFARGIAFYFLGHRGRALADFECTLRDLSLDSPQGFFEETCSLIVITLRGGDPEHDQAALGLLEKLSQRIKGLRGWRHVRSRWIWARGQVRARQGDIALARKDLETAFQRHLTAGLPREAVATSLDVAQLLCRRDDPWGENAASARREVGRCLARRTDLPETLREGLVEMQNVLKRHAHVALRELVAFRRSFIATIPGVMAERLGKK